jgi:hypothetical protein
MLTRVIPAPKIGLSSSDNSSGASLEPRAAPTTTPTSEKTPARKPVRAPRSTTRNTNSAIKRSTVFTRQILPFQATLLEPPV